MKKFSIKTVDGSRFDYVDTDNLIPDIDSLMEGWRNGCFRGFPIEGGYKYFNIENIVSITVRELDNA